MRFPGRPQGVEDETPPPVRSNVEQIEARLCLGTLNAPPIGDWPGVVVDNAVPSAAFLSIASSIGDSTTAQLPETNEFPIPANNSGGQSTAGSSSSQTTSPSGQQSPGSTDVSIGLGIGDQLLANSLLASQLAAGDSGTATAAQGDGGGDGGPTGTGNGDETEQTQSANPAGTPDASNSSGGEAISTENPSNGSIDSDTLSAIGFTLDADGNATGIREWWNFFADPIEVKYDFRDVGNFENEVTQEQKDAAVDALNAWMAATDGRIQFVHDTQAADSEILNLGIGDLAAFGGVSGTDGTLGVGGGGLIGSMASPTVRGVVWLDQAENWDLEIGNGDPQGTYDFFTVISHETGHALGFVDNYDNSNGNMMNGIYDIERSAESIEFAMQHGAIRSSFFDFNSDSYEVSPMMTGFPQLVEAEVEQLLDRAAAASASDDAIIAVVDRGGNILGVRVEQQALANLPDVRSLVFAIDGAVAKARTAAFFSNGDPDNGTLAPLTSRLVQFVSQSTVTQREVESNPNSELAPAPNGTQTVAAVNASTVYGPGTVAPIGLGGHFPPGVEYTPPVDLFGIEHTNRDSLVHPGADGIKGTADDIALPNRFNVANANIPMGQGTNAPESYGLISGLLTNAQARGIATLPGGIPIFRDTNNDSVGETLVGGIGVFFPGTTGFASFEQGFVQGTGQSTLELLNAPRVLEAEFIAYAAVGGSALAQGDGINGAQIGSLGGINRVDRIDLPFGRLDLVGINLPVLGPTAGRLGLDQLLSVGRGLGTGNPNSGANQQLNAAGTVFSVRGQSVAEGVLVTPHDAPGGGLTAQDVQQIINSSQQAAQQVRAAVRLPVSSRTRMVFAVSDLNGEILGLFRMKDATFFSVDVAVAKARNTAYYADTTALQPFDQVVQPGAALTNRTFRFLSEARYPDGIDREQPGPFSILNHPNIDPLTGENIGGPAAAGTFDPAVNPNTASVLGFDSFFPNTNFQDPDNAANQNGIVFFPGSVPLYKNGQLVGGFGVSGDGVDQDDVVTFLGATGFLPPNNLRADQFTFRDVRLPFQKFLRNPFG
jgi:uncharacterized protein GlcG (DUF336 family)